jgi:hypothetical protein
VRVEQDFDSNAWTVGPETFQPVRFLCLEVKER